MDTLANNIETTVKNLLVKIGKEKDVDKIKNDLRIVDDLGIDSLDGIELISALEDIFEIDIPDSNFDSSLTVKDIINFVNSSLTSRTQQKQGKIDKTSFINNLNLGTEVLENTRFSPYYRNIESGLGRNITIEKNQFISLGSNDYLGLAANKQMKSQAIKTIKKYGLSMCGTPIVIGQTDINRALEQKIAQFLKQDDAIIYPSGYQANIGVFQLLASKDDVIIADKNIHSSLINGCKLTQADLRFFTHNNMENLKELLAGSTKYRMRFIVCEGLYSTDGDIASLDKIAKLTKEFDAFLIVDDAHGVGVLGDEGRGILEKFNAYQDIDLLTGSLGKALGVFGGFLAGKQRLIDYFKYNSPMYFYSTALPPYIAAATIASIDFVKAHNDIREKIYKYKDRLYAALKEMGYRLTDSTTPLFSILFNDSYETIKFTQLLFKKRVYVVAFIPPSVPKESPRIRLLASAYLNNKDIDKVIAVFKDLRSSYVG